LKISDLCILEDFRQFVVKNYFGITGFTINKAIDDYIESFNPPVRTVQDCPNGCEGLTYTHDDKVTKSCCTCNKEYKLIN
jgi:hypothetical protein